MKKLFTLFFITVLFVLSSAISVSAASEYDSLTISDDEYTILTNQNNYNDYTKENGYLQTNKENVMKCYFPGELVEGIADGKSYQEVIASGSFYFTEKSLCGKGPLYFIKDGRIETADGGDISDRESEIFESIIGSNSYTADGKSAKINNLYYFRDYLGAVAVVYDTDDGYYTDLYPNGIENELVYKSLSTEQIGYIYKICNEYITEIYEKDPDIIGVGFFDPIKTKIELSEVQTAGNESETQVNVEASDNSEVTADNDKSAAYILIAVIAAVLIITVLIVFIIKAKSKPHK